MYRIMEIGLRFVNCLWWVRLLFGAAVLATNKWRWPFGPGLFWHQPFRP